MFTVAFGFIIEFVESQFLPCCSVDDQQIDIFCTTSAKQCYIVCLLLTLIQFSYILENLAAANGLQGNSHLVEEIHASVFADVVAEIPTVTDSLLRPL